MAGPTLADLFNVQTPELNTQALLTSLVGKGFTQATSWPSGSSPRTLVEIEGEALTDFQQARATIAAGALLDYATGDWLTLRAKSVYDLARDPAGFTEGVVVLQDVLNAGPFNIAPGGAAFSVGPGGYLYRAINAATITLPLGGTLSVPVRAQSPGSKFNVANGQINYYAVGRLPGVTVTNVGPLGSNWITLQGYDATPDDKLREASRGKWGTLGTGSPEKAYITWALTAPGASAVTKVSVLTNRHPDDPGEVDVILATASGGANAATVKAVQDFIAPLQIGGFRIPETAKCVVRSAVQIDFPLVCDIYLEAALNTPTFQQTFYDNVATYEAALPIGAYVDYERLIEVVGFPAALKAGIIKRMTWFGPLVDRQLGLTEVAKLTPSFTFKSI